MSIAKDSKLTHTKDFSLSAFMVDGGVILGEVAGIDLPRSTHTSLIQTLLSPNPVMLIDTSGEGCSYLRTVLHQGFWHQIDWSKARKELGTMKQVFLQGGIIYSEIDGSLEEASHSYGWLRRAHEYLLSAYDFLSESKRAVQKQLFISTRNASAIVPDSLSSTLNMVRFEVSNPSVSLRTNTVVWPPAV